MTARDASLSALSYYEAIRDNDMEAQANIVSNSPNGEVLMGLLTLVGSLLRSTAAKSGCTEDELIATLRRMWLVTS